MIEKRDVGLDGNVACLIVTYQDRRDYLRQVISRIGELKPTVCAITIVFNGVPYDPNEFALEFKSGPTLGLVILDANMGSAHGYAAALEAAQRQSAADYYWMLDDDNLPDEDSLRHFEAAFSLLGSDKNCSLLALRQDRWEYLSVLHTGRHHRLENDAFFGFHAFSTVRRKLAGVRPARVSREGHAAYPLVEVGHAPYGGLLIHRQWVERVGLPKREFFVYGDDHEYTDRIVQAGGRIYLCAASKVEDIERSWFLKSTGRCHYLVDPEASGFKAFLVLRNRTHLESKRYIKSQAVYRLNATVFAFRIVAGGLRHWLDRRFWMRLRLLAAAYREGRSGSLRVMNDELKHWINHHG